MVITKVVTDTKEAIEWTRQVKRVFNESHPVLHEVRMHVWRGATLYLVINRFGRPVHFNVTKLGKRKKNAWEPYANWYVAYTVGKYRRQGLAYQTALQVRAVARSYGCVRLKSLAGTLAGVSLHGRLGDQFWGITPNLEAIVDTPLVNNPAWAGKVPTGIKTDLLSPLNLEGVLKRMRGYSFKYDIGRGVNHA